MLANIAVSGQTLQANNSTNATGQGENVADSGMSVSGGTDSNSVVNKQKLNDNQAAVKTPGASAASSTGPFDLTGTLALDDDKNVVVQFVDKTGKVVSQFPPEDYLKMMEKLKKSIDNLFHKTA